MPRSIQMAPVLFTLRPLVWVHRMASPNTSTIVPLGMVCHVPDGVTTVLRYQWATQSGSPQSILGKPAPSPSMKQGLIPANLAVVVVHVLPWPTGTRALAMLRSAKDWARLH